MPNGNVSVTPFVKSPFAWPVVPSIAVDARGGRSRVDDVEVAIGADPHLFLALQACVRVSQAEAGSSDRELADVGLVEGSALVVVP